MGEYVRGEVLYSEPNLALECTVGPGRPRLSLLCRKHDHRVREPETTPGPIKGLTRNIKTGTYLENIAFSLECARSLPSTLQLEVSTEISLFSQIPCENTDSPSVWCEDIVPLFRCVVTKNIFSNRRPPRPLSPPRFETGIGI